MPSPPRFTIATTTEILRECASRGFPTRSLSAASKPNSASRRSASVPRILSSAARFRLIHRDLSRGSADMIDAWSSDCEGRAEAEILRSFARRIDPTDPGAAEQSRCPLLSPGPVRRSNWRLFRGRSPSTSECGWPGGTSRSRTERLACWSGELRSWSSGLLESPDDIGALVESGIAQKSTGKLDLAETKFRRALQHDPESSVLHFFSPKFSTIAAVAKKHSDLWTLDRAESREPRRALSGWLHPRRSRNGGRSPGSKSQGRGVEPALSAAPRQIFLSTHFAAADGAGKTGATVEKRKPAAASSHLTLALALRVKGYYRGSVAGMPGGLGKR